MVECKALVSVLSGKDSVPHPLSLFIVSTQGKNRSLLHGQQSIGGESDTTIFEAKRFDSDLSRVLPMDDGNRLVNMSIHRRRKIHGKPKWPINCC